MLEAIIRRLRHDRHGISNVIVIMLSLILIVIIVGNVVLWSYQMNQLDWERMEENISIANVERVNRSSWFAVQSEYTINYGSHMSGSYTDTQAVDSNYERFTEALATLTYYPNGYNVLYGTYLYGSVPSSIQTVDSEYFITRSAGTASSTIAEFTFSNMSTQAPTQLNFTVVSEYDTANVNVTVQVWNYSASAYVTNGEGYLTYVSSGLNETKLLSINISPQFYVSNGNAKIEITGVKSTTSQYSQKINQIQLYYKIENKLNINGACSIDLSEYPLSCIQTVEIQIRYRASDNDERWYLKAYNWTKAAYGDAGFNSTIGHSPTTGWDYYTVNLAASWRDYVWNNGTIYVQFIDQGPDSKSTVIDIDFLGVRAVIDGTSFLFKNEGALTLHLISLWINNATNHQHYDVNVFVNSGETATYVRTDIRLPHENFIVKVVTERGNTAVFTSH